jgi:nitrate reductase molybdenum cofactor assembly chaperone NarJ/NarW
MTPADAMAQFSRTMRIASLALGYPDDEWRRTLPLLHDATATLAGPGQALMRRFLDVTAGHDPTLLQQAYVDTFDLRRRCCLYLTYYSCGDTRKRGMALLQFTAAYRAAGFELTASELPDHLAVLCEFTAAAAERGRAMFRRHRAGLELLRTALGDAQSPWLHVIDAVRGILPDAAPRDLQRALELARTGPPAAGCGPRRETRLGAGPAPRAITGRWQRPAAASS